MFRERNWFSPSQLLFLKLEGDKKNLELLWATSKLTFLLKGKQPGFSTTGGAFISKSGVGLSLVPKTLSSRKHSVSIISFCHGIETDPVLNLV